MEELAAVRPPGEDPLHRQAVEILEFKKANAWFDYLESTRGLTGQRYTEAESWAGAKLDMEIKSINQRLANLGDTPKPQ